MDSENKAETEADSVPGEDANESTFTSAVSGTAGAEIPDFLSGMQYSDVLANIAKKGISVDIWK